MCPSNGWNKPMPAHVSAKTGLASGAGDGEPLGLGLGLGLWLGLGLGLGLWLGLGLGLGLWLGLGLGFGLWLGLGLGLWLELGLGLGELIGIGVGEVDNPGIALTALVPPPPHAVTASANDAATPAVNKRTIRRFFPIDPPKDCGANANTLVRHA